MRRPTTHRTGRKPNRARLLRTVEELQAHKEAIEERAKGQWSKDGFPRCVKHDLQNALGEANMYLNNARDELDGRDLCTARRQINDARTSLHFTEDVIDSHGDFKRTRFRARKFAERTFAYPKVILNAQYESGPKQFTIDQRGLRNPWMRADPRWMHRVGFNLVDNAMRFVDSRGRVSFSTDKNNFIMEVANDGPNMTPEEKRKVFDGIQFTTKEMNGQDHGVGLKIVREAVEKHGGRLEILDSHPQGTIFRISIPLKPKE